MGHGRPTKAQVGRHRDSKCKPSGNTTLECPDEGVGAWTEVTFGLAVITNTLSNRADLSFRNRWLSDNGYAKNPATEYAAKKGVDRESIVRPIVGTPEVGSWNAYSIRPGQWGGATPQQRSALAYSAMVMYDPDLLYRVERWSGRSPEESDTLLGRNYPHLNDKTKRDVEDHYSFKPEETRDASGTTDGTGTVSCPDDCNLEQRKKASEKGSVNHEEATGNYDIEVLEVSNMASGGGGAGNTVAVCIKAEFRCVPKEAPKFSPADPRFYSSREDEKFDSIAQAWRLWNKHLQRQRQQRMGVHAGGNCGGPCGCVSCVGRISETSYWSALRLSGGSPSAFWSAAVVYDGLRSSPDQRERSEVSDLYASFIKEGIYNGMG